MPSESNGGKSAPHAHHIRVEKTARFYTLGGEARCDSAWIVLHGYGQLAAEFIRFFSDLATDHTLVVAPEALNRYYLVGPSKAPAQERPVGATWMTREDRASEIGDYVEYLDAVYDEVSTRFAAGATISVIGFSQGAATATRWLTHGRSRIHRLVLWGGLIPPDTDLTAGHATIRGVPLTLVVGNRDHYIDAATLAAERSRLDAAALPYELIEFDGGHAVSRSVFPRLLQPRRDALEQR